MPENNYCAQCAEYVTPFPNGACSSCYEKAGMRDGPGPSPEAQPEEQGLAADWEPEAPQDTRGLGDENYRPIGSSRSGSSGRRWEDFEYGDTSGLTMTVKLFLGFGVITSASIVITFLLQINLLNQADFTAAEAEANNLRQALVLFIHSIGVLLTFPFFALWILRSNRNVHALGAVGMNHSPGIALGSFFIPFINLVLPCIAMRELERASADPRGWRKSRGGALTFLWWTAYIGTAIFRWNTNALAKSAKGTEDYLELSYYQIATSSAHMFLCIAAFLLVSRIAKTQRSHVE